MIDLEHKDAPVLPCDCGDPECTVDDLLEQRLLCVQKLGKQTAEQHFWRFRHNDCLSKFYAAPPPTQFAEFARVATGQDLYHAGMKAPPVEPLNTNVWVREAGKSHLMESLLHNAGPTEVDDWWHAPANPDGWHTQLRQRIPHAADLVAEAQREKRNRGLTIALIALGTIIGIGLAFITFVLLMR